LEVSAGADAPRRRGLAAPPPAVAPRATPAKAAPAPAPAPAPAAPCSSPRKQLDFAAAPASLGKREVASLQRGLGAWGAAAPRRRA
jgi:hypothetical protein